MKIKKLVISIFIFLCTIIIFSGLSLASSDIIVALDPGHGGNDPGAIGGNLRESDLTWKIASRVKEILDATPGITGVLTKSQYEDLDSREERARRAVENNADLLVSFHINSNASSNSMSGAEVYITHSTAERRFYEYSNILGLDILQNLRNVGVQSHSPKPLVRVGADWDKYDDGTIADYYGIISWPMHMGIPGMIIEHAFINNPYDRANYLNDTMLNKMAEADAQAIIANKELFRRTYYGTINTELKSINVITGGNGKTYISGYIDIGELVDGNCNTPKGTPQLTLKSTDGVWNQNMYVSSDPSGITYYFDTVVDDLDINREYYIEAYLTGENNTAPTNVKTQVVQIPAGELGDTKYATLKIGDNKIYFNYEAELINTLKEFDVIDSNGKKYIKGKLNIQEGKDGKRYGLMQDQTKIKLKSTDGTFEKEMFYYLEVGSLFYFDTTIDKLDTSKEYYIEIEDTNERNLIDSSEKIKKLGIPNQTLGNQQELHVKIENNNIILTNEYTGSIKTSLEDLYLRDNGSGRHYICGDLRVSVVIDGKEQKSEILPSLTLKGENGYSQTMYVNDSGNGSYYFDTYIEDIVQDQNYYIEAKLTDSNNSATEEDRTMKVEIPNQTLGKMGGQKVVIEDSSIKFVDGDKYIGQISTNLGDLYLRDNGSGRHYICGDIKIQEVVGGERQKPEVLPTLTLVGEDGYRQTMYINDSGNGSYYFDTYVEDIDKNQNYYIEAKLTGKNNIAEEKDKTMKVIIPSQTLGKMGDLKVVIENSNMRFVDGDKYVGTIETNLEGLYLRDNGSGRHYICGDIIIQEVVNRNKQKPESLPTLTLVGEDGSRQTMYVNDSGNGSYYFDTYIEDINKNQSYYIEAKLTGNNNTATEKDKTMKVLIPSQTLGKMGDLKVVIENSNMRFVDGDKYVGTIGTSLEGLYLRDNGSGRHYICGDVIIQEVVNGNKQKPESLPTLTLVGEDGSRQTMYVNDSGNGSYYFDTYIEDINKEQSYYIEAKLTGNNNTATEKDRTMKIEIPTQILGEMENIKVKIENSELKFEMPMTLVTKQKVEQKQENELQENITVETPKEANETEEELKEGLKEEEQKSLMEETDSEENIETNE